jgi:hypothetical protein
MAIALTHVISFAWLTVNRRHVWCNSVWQEGMLAYFFSFPLQRTGILLVSITDGHIYFNEV